MAATAIEHAGVWTHADDRRTFSLSLGADESCEVAAFEIATRKAKKTRCRYSLDRPKIRLRAMKIPVAKLIDGAIREGASSGQEAELVQKATVIELGADIRARGDRVLYVEN